MLMMYKFKHRTKKKSFNVIPRVIHVNLIKNNFYNLLQKKKKNSFHIINISG